MLNYKGLATTATHYWMDANSWHKKQLCCKAVLLLRPLALPLVFDWDSEKFGLRRLFLLHIWILKSLIQNFFCFLFILWFWGFLFFVLLMIRLYQLFCWWRCPQLILGCLVFQEVSFYSSGPSPTPTSLVIPDWNLSEPQQAGNLLLYKNTLHCFFFLLF